MAAYLPEQMTSEEKNDVKNFMSTLGKFYPCDVCAHELSNRWLFLSQFHSCIIGSVVILIITAPIIANILIVDLV